MKRTIKIHIGGQQYILRSDADESYVQALADSVNSRLDAFKGSRQVATQSDVVLAALKLADELEHEKQSQTRLRAQVRGQVELMLGQVEAQLQAPPSAGSASSSRRAVRSPKVAATATPKAR
ncbi:MAG TPA: cell division protein ZapA [Pseudomonadota bacterium]|nr:cell division protein ZapA [Pseudomonadota bacterium]